MSVPKKVPYEDDQDELPQEIEKVRNVLYRMVGQTYDPEAIQKAGNVSSYLDILINQYMKNQKKKDEP